MVMNVSYLAALGVRNVVGLCHSVYWTMEGLSELVGVPHDDVTYLAAGVNHQWVLRFEHDSEDLYERLDAAIAADPELRRRVRMDMYRRLGSIRPRPVSTRRSTCRGTCRIRAR